MNRTYRASLAAGASALALVALSSVYAGPEWPEMGDAGSTIGGAQNPSGSGKNGRISGALTGSSPLTLGPGGPGDKDFQDLYVIYIKNVNCFRATLDPMLNGDADFDTQLFLFGNDGVGLLANDEVFPGSGFSELTGESDDQTNFQLQRNGVYIIGISGFDSDPANPGGAIFDQMAPDEISGPDGPGGLAAGGPGDLQFWSPPQGDTGTYSIVLDGVYFEQEFQCRADCAPFDFTTCTVGNGEVNIDDLLAVINRFGMSGPGEPCDTVPVLPDGTYGNQMVNIDDLLFVINSFGINCDNPV
ncbi:MAG: hypothetical protein AAF432_06255 [Planctomycetota bacterium]